MPWLFNAAPTPHVSEVPMSTVSLDVHVGWMVMLGCGEDYRFPLGFAGGGSVLGGHHDRWTGIGTVALADAPAPSWRAYVVSLRWTRARAR